MPRQKNSTTGQSTIMSKLSNVWGLIISALTLLSFGIGVGYWVGKSDSKLEVYKLILDYQSEIAKLQKKIDDCPEEVELKTTENIERSIPI